MLAPRETVGVDIDPSALAGQERETLVADMRALPFPDASFASVLAVHSIEHVPDPERVLDEVVRVLEPGGAAVFVTPNRLTFARPDEIIDPYHFVEYDPDELEALCAPRFDRVAMHGLFGSDRYLALVDEQQRRARPPAGPGPAAPAAPGAPRAAPAALRPHADPGAARRRSPRRRDQARGLRAARHGARGLPRRGRGVPGGLTARPRSSATNARIIPAQTASMGAT